MVAHWSLSKDPAGTGRASRWRRLLRGGALLSGSMALLTLGSSATVAHLVTSPRHRRSIQPRQIDETIEEITFQTDENLTLSGWYLAHPSPTDLLIICHGYAMNRHELLDLAQELRQRGHAILLFDFRGHGSSDGRRSTMGLREANDIIAALNYSQQRPELADLPIGVAGISMGGAASLLAAARDQRIAAVVADSSFAALADTVRGNLRELSHRAITPLSPLIIRFSELLTHARVRINRPVDAIAAIAPRPVLIIHDSNDTFIPVDNAYALHTAAREPKALWIRPGQGHASLWACCASEYIEQIDRFFTQSFNNLVAIGSEAKLPG